MAGTPATMSALGDQVIQEPPATGSPQWEYNWLQSHGLHVLASMVQSHIPKETKEHK